MAAVFVLPDEILFERQRKQSQEEGKQVPEEAMADMRGMHVTPPPHHEFFKYHQSSSRAHGNVLQILIVLHAGQAVHGRSWQGQASWITCILNAAC